MQEEAEAEWGGKNWPPLSQLALRMRLTKVCFCLGFFTLAPLSAALFQHFFTRRFERGRGNVSEIDSWKKLGTH